MTINDRTIKAVHASEYVVFTMTVDRRIRIF